MTDLPKAIRDDLVARPAADPAHPAGAAHRRRRRDDQVGLAAARRRHRRVGAHALPQPRHHLHLQPGRLRHELPLLRHRPGGPDPQHVGRRDRRAGRVCRARSLRRRRALPAGELRRGPRGAAARVQRRVHGHGRGAGQLQGGDRRDPAADRPGARRARHVGARHHHVDRRPGPGHRQARRRGHPGDPGPVAARPRRRAAQRAGADQHPLEGRRGARRRAPLLRGHRAAG